jgi:hypothetical protein
MLNAFDLLALSGEDLRPLPLGERTESHPSGRPPPGGRHSAMTVALA